MEYYLIPFSEGFFKLEEKRVMCDNEDLRRVSMEANTH